MLATLLDTTNLNDALATGHKSPIDYTEGGLRITFEAHEALGPSVRLFGIEGEIELTGDAEIAEVIRALEMARKFTVNSRKTA